MLFRDTTPFAAHLLDEVHAVTSSAQSRELVVDLIRDGRKHFAAVWAFSQLHGDLTGGNGEGDRRPPRIPDGVPLVPPDGG